jgi:hypothetical protein
MNANDLKTEGNLHFSRKEFHDAISCYTKAIVSLYICVHRLLRRAVCRRSLSNSLRFHFDPALKKAKTETAAPAVHFYGKFDKFVLGRPSHCTV